MGKLVSFSLDEVVSEGKVIRKGPTATVYLQDHERLGVPLSQVPKITDIEHRDRSDFEIFEETYLIYMDRTE